MRTLHVGQQQLTTRVAAFPVQRQQQRAVDQDNTYIFVETVSDFRTYFEHFHEQAYLQILQIQCS